MSLLVTSAAALLGLNIQLVVQYMSEYLVVHWDWLYILVVKYTVEDLA